MEGPGTGEGFGLFRSPEPTGEAAPAIFGFFGQLSPSIFSIKFSGNISRVNSLQVRTLQLSQFGIEIGTGGDVERELMTGAHSKG